MKTREVVSLALVLICLAATEARAGQVAVEFTTKAWVNVDTFGDLAAAGIESHVTEIRGRIVYDTESPPWNTNEPYGFAQYWSDSFTIDIGDNFTWTKTQGGNGIVIANNRAVGSNVYDGFEISENGEAHFGGKVVRMRGGVWWQDKSCAPFDSIDLPSAAELSAFHVDAAYFSALEGKFDGQVAWRINRSGPIEWSVSAVAPEPICIQASGAVYHAANLTPEYMWMSEQIGARLTVRYTMDRLDASDGTLNAEGTGITWTFPGEPGPTMDRSATLGGVPLPLPCSANDMGSAYNLHDRVESGLFGADRKWWLQDFGWGSDGCWLTTETRASDCPPGTVGEPSTSLLPEGDLGLCGQPSIIVNLSPGPAGEEFTLFAHLDEFTECGDEAPDADGDGVPDAEDACPGFDDNLDSDGDGAADGCDACPLDFFNDSDGDGACDSADLCPLDALDDVDGDGLCADIDPCPEYPWNDEDGDGICGDVDACPLDPVNDADGDGVCGNEDACPGGDDSLDADGDGTADFCDQCPLDDANDADGDGVCGDVDPCPLDAQDDQDGDGACDSDDTCPLDAANDADGDGICGDVDPCPVDFANDADGDGICESDDNCPTVANTNQSNVDGDAFGDACEPDNDDDGVIDDLDNCPLDTNPDQADFDGDGYGDACDADVDDDGVTDGDDVCLGTPLGATVLANGCAVAQQCLCEAPWKNHGAYVSCVAHAAEELLEAGLIGLAEKSALCSAAGQSDCGAKAKKK